MMSNSIAVLLLRASAILWIIWGLVHMLAGVLTIQQETVDAVAGIADAVDPLTLVTVYPDAAGAVINQHGFNLFWVGAVTIVAAVFIWRKNTDAIFLATLVGGLTDVGYFIFMDLGGFVNFAPGTVMTIFSSAAVIFSLTAYFGNLKPAHAS